MEKEEENELYVNDKDGGLNNTDGVINTEVNQEDVVNENTDSVETTEPEKTYTQEEVDKILNARTESMNRKHQKELRKYRNIENTLKQGLQVDSIDEVEEQLRNFYKDNGVDIKDDSNLRDEQEEKILGRAEANEIISLGEAEMIRTANELAGKQRTVREHEEFMTICGELSKNNAKKELKKLGVDDSILETKKFREFAQMFNSNTSLVDIYNIYAKNEGMKKQQPKVIGSMKNNSNNISEVKDFYTPEEAKKFTVKDFDRNPKLFEAVTKSMEKWK